MKVAVVVGTRPEIVKMAPVIRAIRRRGAECLIVHSGQHYSRAMTGIFFEQLDLPQPDVNLEVGSGSHSYQIGNVILGMEEVLVRERPDVVLVEGDTNTVLAAGLAANKTGTRLGHVEAGLRSRDRTMPEEINRILIDHAADVLFAPTPATAANLRRESIPADRIEVTGNTVVDEVLLQTRRALSGNGGAAAPSGRYALATVHRAENTDSPDRLRGIMDGLAGVADALGMPVLLSLHPRTAARLAEHGIAMSAAISVMEPVGYLESLALQARAALVLTDSGGLQEETCTLGVPCVTLRDNTERPESVDVGANRLAGTNPRVIVEAALAMADRRGGWQNPFGDGRAGERIAASLLGTRLTPVAMEVARPMVAPEPISAPSA